MMIGIPKELKDHETRVALTPEAVANLVAAGHRVWVQAGAGEKSGFTDAQYREAGAGMASDIRQVYRRAELIVKVKEPLPAEYKLFRPGLWVFCYLHLAANPALTRALQASGCVALAFETLQDSTGATPLLRPMSEIAGMLSVTIGAHYLQSDVGGKGVLLPRTQSTLGGQVVVVGGGAVGRAAAQCAWGLGAEVTVFDIRPKPLATWATQHRGVRVRHASGIAIAAALRQADLVVGAVYVPGARAPKVICEKMVKAMQPGSVLVDVAVDQGGASETTRATSHSRPIYLRHEVIHYAVPNMPALVGRSATQALSRAILPDVRRLAALKDLAAIQKNARMKSALNVAQGRVLLSLL